MVAPAVRRVALLNLLRTRFQCEVRSGRGSETTVWRAGGRKFTLPGHKRNEHIHPRTVRALLKAVGVPVEEFCAAAAQRVPRSTG